MSGTLLAFDFGTKSIGVAVGQRITGTARPLPAIKAQDGTPDWNIIERLLKEWQPDEIIVGLPLNMDGTEQPLTARARNFANRIHGRFGVDVKLHDERLRTVEARSGLFELGGYRALYAGLEPHRTFTERVAAGRNHRRFAAEYGRHRATIDCQSA